MTLPSPRNRRITASNTPRRSCCSGRLGAVVAFVGALCFTTLSLAGEFVQPRGINLLRSLRQRAAADRARLRGGRPVPNARPLVRPITTKREPVYGVFGRPMQVPPPPEPDETPQNAVAPATADLESKELRVQPVQFQPKVPPLRRAPTERPSRYDEPFQLRPLDDISADYDYIPRELDPPAELLTPLVSGIGSTLSSGLLERLRTQKPALLQRDAPEEAWEERPAPVRVYEPVRFAWEASNFAYNPLYFEDPSLERYGHAFPDYVQPFVSVGKFGAQLMGLPYQTAIDPVHKCVYPLGWYMPGECAPKLCYQVPWNAEAAGVEAGVAAGLIFLIP